MCNVGIHLILKAERVNSNIMKKIQYSKKVIEKHFKLHKIATMPELKVLLGTSVDMTILRKLRQLNYHSSYSHRGKFYTLDMVAQFGQNGLWFFNSAHFSRHGTLVNTCRHFVDNSIQGYSVKELNTILGVETKQTLLELSRLDTIVREKISGQYIYFTKNYSKKNGQVAMRNDTLSSSIIGTTDGGKEVLAHEMKAAIVLFYGLLDERHRRLYAGLEALKAGHGGDSAIARLLGIDARTVAHGRKELLAHPEKSTALRKAGGGRKSSKKTIRS